MAEDKNVPVTDEELELERQRELEEKEKNSDVDTSIPKEEVDEEENSDQGQDEESSAEEEDTEQEPQAPDGADEDAEPRQTRKERRAERAKRFSELRQDYRQRDAQRQQLMNRQGYKPIEYDSLGNEVNLDELDKDRTQYGDSRFSEGAQLERFYAEQERFNDKLESDNDYILSRPEYQFLDENNKETFDADLADGINDLYLTIAGYDPQTRTYANTDIRYKQFVPMMKSMMDKYAATRNANSEANISKQRSSGGVKPTGGGSRSGTRTFTPEQVASMSDAQYARYSKDIERQINSMI